MQNTSSTLFFLIILFFSHTSCKRDMENNSLSASLILYNAFVYPVVGTPIENGAVVISEGKIIATGESDIILKKWKKENTETIDCKSQFLMPGFIEGHAHFHKLGNNLLELDLLETSSWDEIVDSVRARVAISKPGEWIVGRGWHQEKWNKPVSPSFQGYPYHDALSRVSPNNPVALTHASGHALLANAKAMEVVGISSETPNPDGGFIVRDKQGIITGVFEENALLLIDDVYDAHIANLSKDEQDNRWKASMLKVQEHCLKYGITMFQDAASTFEEVEGYRKMAREDSLQLRLYVMLYEKLDSMRGRIDDFPVIGEGNDFFTCRAIKGFSDGALGSYGAWLLEPYEDRPGHTGQVTTSVDEVKATAAFSLDHGMQMAVHAIGDRANQSVLDTYESLMETHPDKKDLRWRIEHAQHIDPTDIPRFKELGVIASMQAVHCTSDAPFVVKRLGEDRARSGAYPWRSLLDSGAVIANGTDAPVEKVDPIANFFASVTRKRPEGGDAFFPEQAMTREEAIYSLTKANAYAAFQENNLGSIEPGKYADLVLLSKNLLNCAEGEILDTKVMMTIVDGKVKYIAER